MSKGLQARPVTIVYIDGIPTELLSSISMPYVKPFRKSDGHVSPELRGSQGSRGYRIAGTASGSKVYPGGRRT